MVAHRDFGRKFEFIAGDFKPTAYYAECVDLIRKLVLSGVIGLINPGTVFQSFCSVLFSLVFLVIHIKLWPYPSRSSNLLKMFADAQVFLVTLVGLILRIDESDLAKDPFAEGFGLTRVSARELVSFCVPPPFANRRARSWSTACSAIIICQSFRSRCTATYSGACCC